MCGGACRVASLIGLWLIGPQSIEGMLRTQPGIQSVKVALLAERGVVEYDPAVWDADKIIGVSASTCRHPLVPSGLCVSSSRPREFRLARQILFSLHVKHIYMPKRC